MTDKMTRDEVLMILGTHASMARADGRSEDGLDLSKVEDAVSAMFDEVEALREASERQCDNISFMLERLELPDLPAAWTTKFEKELAEDRAAILRTKGGA